MKLKHELKWLIPFGMLSILIVGILTDFQYRKFEDDYFISRPFEAVLYLTLLFLSIKNLYLFIDIVTKKYDVLAVFISIINPLIGLFVIIFMYMKIQSLMVFNGSYADHDLAAQIMLVIFLSVVFVLQVLLEISMMRRMWMLLK